jgi:intraflagellar transport protein 140
MRYAMKSTHALMVECAQHFESKGEFDKAMQLFHKGGDTPRALELCFRVGEDTNNPHTGMAFDMLNSIAQELGTDSSPAILARCGDFLVQHQQYDKAVDLYVMAKRFHPAVDMCLQHRVFISETLADRLTPSEDMEISERKEILKNLAKALKKQGSFLLASKKYTQAGDRVKAIKCLVHSGDTKAVIQFATISRNPEIYTLAANYLQQMNWRGSIEIMKAIVTFYTKAKSFIQLARFYDSCAQVEIDEYRDYEKASGALNEALKYLSKDNSRSAVELLHLFEKKLMLIDKFIEAKNCQNDVGKMMAICEAILQDPMIEDAIRVGDCYAILIENHCHQGNYQDAYNYLKEMQERKIQIQMYVDKSMIESILKAVGVTSSRSNTVADSKVDDNFKNTHPEDEEIGEEINEVSFQFPSNLLI